MKQEYNGLVVQRATIGKNICFTLAGEEALSRTWYKMMQGMLSGSLLPCVLYRYNGRPKLMYVSGEKKPLSSFDEVDEESAFRVIRGVLEAAQTVFEADFLNFNNILCSDQWIFADPQGTECGFLFLPLNNEGDSAGREQFEKKVIETVCSFVLRHCLRPGASLRTLTAEATRPDMTLPQMLRIVNMLDTAGGNTELRQASMNTGSRLVLTGMGEAAGVKLLITKPEFIVGKSVNGVDGTLAFNPAISRVHCKFIQNGMKMFITDMGSSNGTYVNGVRIGEGQAVPVQVGDTIRLANSEFVLQGG